MELPTGFEFAGLACGIKRSGKPDLALVACPEPAVAAGVYTQNVVRAASIDWNRDITPTDQFRALVVNSGNANACTGRQGQEDNEALATAMAYRISAQPRSIAVLSTGVIGRHLPMDKIKPGIDSLVDAAEHSLDGFQRAAQAITTTDKNIKTVMTQLRHAGATVRIAGMAKGAGMIGPKMATMLAVICTDAKIDPQVAQEMVRIAAEQSFNRISVEGHTSTNDALMLLASGAAGSAVDWNQLEARESFQEALNQACIELAKQIPADGEGATHLVEIRITGAASDQSADQIARTIAASNLVKTAITGGDPNWGRIVSAAGYSEQAMELSRTRLTINGHLLFDQGEPMAFDETSVSAAMKNQFETQIDLLVGGGPGTARHWTSDLTVDYVKFNSEYTT